jgi:hypothetical protein
VFRWLNLKERDSWEELGLDGRIILKLMLNKQDRIFNPEPPQVADPS